MHLMRISTHYDSPTGKKYSTPFYLVRLTSRDDNVLCYCDCSIGPPKLERDWTIVFNLYGEDLYSCIPCGLINNVGTTPIRDVFPNDVMSHSLMQCFGSYGNKLSVEAHLDQSLVDEEV